jgi:8-oxo-dGTP diphosphatase
MSAAPIEVAAGLIFQRGRLLITQRYAGAHLGGLWEFPGGKRELDETYERCLERELKEELEIEVRVGRLIDAVTHSYPGKTVHLKFFLCELLRGEPRATGCAAFKWVGREELAAHEFPAADARLLERVRAADWWTHPPM